MFCGVAWLKWGVVVALLVMGAANARPFEDMEVADSVTIGDRHLMLNGVALQKKLIFRIYTVALYLEHPTHDWATAIHSDQVKRLTLHMLRNASREQLTSALRSDFQEVGGPLSPSLRERLDHALAGLPGLQENDELRLTYLPGEGTHVAWRGKEQLVIPGKDFADILFGIWMNGRASIQELRNGLMGT